MARPSWDGYLRVNLIAVPVKAFNAAATGHGKVGFHLIHANCGLRIRYQKVCPVHGEVSNDEIVSGYEVEKGKYVTVEKEERRKVRLEDDKAINIDTFVKPGAVDPIYYSGKAYYLVPDGKVAQKPYALLLEAMRENERYGIAQVILSGRGQIAVVRPAGEVLSMILLNYETQVKKPEEFESQVEHPAISAAEKKLAQTLLESSTARKFDLEQYKDEYNRKLTQLVEGKARKQKPIALAPKRKGEGPAVINLMDALRASLRNTDKTTKSASGGKRRGTARHRHAPRKKSA
jgi:DNA end-binding protein Ku